MTDLFSLVDLLAERHALSHEAYRALVEGQSPELAAYAAKKADAMRREIYGTDVYVRGLIEIGNYCRNDCIYCGIRKSNKNCDRYQLTRKQILECCEEGWNLGFRTFVLQGGEGIVPIVQVCELVRGIKSRYPDCAVTLSLGEYSRADYQAMFDAGADRYLLRHETADKAHYEKLHPASMSFDNRMRCLRDLKEIGYQVGCGIMVGSPYQTTENIIEDIRFMQQLMPHMIGIGPFIPHQDTQFRDKPAGTLEDTLHLLAILRLMFPHVLLPATTALGTIHPLGREMGIQAGANVVMPNLSPTDVRSKYLLYDGKICTGDEAAECRHCMERRMEHIGYQVTVSRGDYRG